MPEGLSVSGLHVSSRPAPAVRRAAGPPGAGPAGRPILSGIDLNVAPGEFVALVGSSGSGKSITAMSILRLLPPQVQIDSGSIRLGGMDVSRAGEKELQSLRGGRIGMLYQQPKRMFNPRRTVGSHLAEPLKLHRGLRGKAARAQVLELLAAAGFEDPARCALAQPHELSGGMAQRAMMAIALAGRPELLLADEPTSALDKVLERQILELIDRERRERGLGVLYITHNLATAAAYADRVVVMADGRIQESGPARSILDDPQSACTRRLVQASALVPAAEPPAQEGRAPAPEGRAGAPHGSSGAPQERAVLALNGVSKHFSSARRGRRTALERVSLELRSGEILGVLGQSGSGKSTMARLMVGLETPDGGSIVRALDPGDSNRGAVDTRVQIVFQEPHDVFDPRMRLYTSLEAPLLRHRDVTAGMRREHIHRVLHEVELDPGLLERFPSQCSGGQLQRLTIARALLLNPQVLICDEATSALDAVTQRTVLDLLLRLHRDRRLSLVMISHDMDVIRYMSQRVAVLYRGALVELAQTGDFFARPRHPHSRQLVALTQEKRVLGPAGTCPSNG